MKYPTQSDLIEAVDVFDFLDEHFLRQDPFAFESSDFGRFVRTCVEALGVDPNAVYCIGSGAVGLSLNPKKIDNGLLKPFDNDSDLDIALISETHFESAWRDLRFKGHPVIAEMEGELAAHLRWQKKRFFDGAIIATHLLPALSFGTDWVSALVRVEETASLILDRNVDVNVWIFRDYWSMRSYVAEGVIKCRKAVAS